MRDFIRRIFCPHQTRRKDPMEHAREVIRTISVNAEDAQALTEHLFRQEAFTSEVKRLFATNVGEADEFIICECISQRQKLPAAMSA